MYQNVLVPTDGSTAAETAVDQGLAIADRFGAAVHVVFVVDLSENYPPTLSTEPLVESLKTEGEELIADIAERSPPDVPVHGAVVEGTPHEEILRHAEEAEIDLIVMGTHGRRGLDRYLLGSVTERVTRSADCSVLVTRAEATEDVVTAADAAVDRAIEALTEAGRTDVEVLEEPYQQAGYWIVRLGTDRGEVNVHVNRSSGHTRVAEVEGR